MKNLLVFLVASLLVLSFQNCSRSKVSTPNITPPIDDGGPGKQNTKYSKTITYMNFYRGGWFPAPGAAGFSHDVDFFFISNKHAYAQFERFGESCLGEVNINQAQISEVLNRINAATQKLAFTSGPVRADGGTEFIDMDFNDGESLKAYIDAAEAPNGSYEITQNGAALSNYLKSLVDNANSMSNQACVGDVLDVVSVKYVRSEWQTRQNGNTQTSTVYITDDYSVNLDTKNLSHTLSDPLCFRERSVTDDEVQDLEDALEVLSLNRQGLDTVFNSREGQEYIELIYADSSSKRVYLDNMNVQAGESLALDGSEVSLLLQDIGDVTTYTACQ